MAIEIYKDIPGYEGSYQVSNYGNIKTLSDRWGRERILKTRINKGYSYIGLYLNHKRKMCAVHQLVAMAFLNHTPNGYELVVNHIDNNPQNNYLDNLELVSIRYNSSCHKTDAGINLEKNMWRARIKINYKLLHLGSFSEKEDALNMYQKAVANLHLYNGNNKAFREALNNL